MRSNDFISVLRMILIRWWIVLIGIVVCTAAAVVISLYFIEPVYQSNTTLYIGKKIDSSQDVTLQYYDLLLGSQLVNDYREIVKSRLVANQVMKELDLNYLSVEAFFAKLSINSKNETRVIQIDVTDTDPVMAKNIADKVAEVFMEKVVEIMHVENVDVIDMAEVPSNAIKPNKVLNTAIGFMLGLVLGISIAFLIGFLDNTVKTAEDIKGHLDLPVIGMIPVFCKQLGGE